MLIVSKPTRRGLGLATLSLISSQVAAQQLAPASVDVLVEELSSEALRCNITKAGLEGAAQSALRYNRISYSKDADTYVYVNANVMSIGVNLCVIALDVSIRQWDTLPDMQGGAYLRFI